jgi:hypothetical protein
MNIGQGAAGHLRPGTAVTLKQRAAHRETRRRGRSGYAMKTGLRLDACGVVSFKGSDCFRVRIIVR